MRRNLTFVEWRSECKAKSDSTAEICEESVGEEKWKECWKRTQPRELTSNDKALTLKGE
ncbi:hypothetical protein TIFTF001_029282 [Ficus carica]|uniref:Uncharacterized protein n=1 Tax=Ficus carica TaxID=3494 RepID=A0AA88DRL6_FICCA|nr:hypothetical protein TIFTF001_029282 [Ficus carica]